MSDHTIDPATVREQVREHYAAAAATVLAAQPGGCCAPAPDATLTCCDETAAEAEVFGPGRYDANDRAGLPVAATTASLGCGNPTAVADLRPGETVLDLGSGGGIDVLISARRVGPTGRAYGLDMTPEMLELARRNAAEAGMDNVEFLRGHIEDIPLPAGGIDVVISNCVINLSVDKPAVFAAMHRVLRPGGRIGISDVVAEDGLTAAERAERGGWAGCIAGALSEGEYRDGLAAAGFTGITVTRTHPVADGMHSAVIRATKPAG
ncbi:methyltransferase domain-containing protein [Amorphoplanes nipponensis]|uniref:Arsenite methyltransferase n=1 Tax=Actinoplanes nipponensis TaxID=135950 RepID=A0A919JQJ7_9ACTN|nr:arsenite methyltransferase [Actinoplanes nipponensis]GIE53635.1 arsenite S-adenosylmethyltransferase [Actinoplanes nipponensis]